MKPDSSSNSAGSASTPVSSHDDLSLVGDKRPAGSGPVVERNQNAVRVLVEDPMSLATRLISGVARLRLVVGRRIELASLGPDFHRTRLVHTEGTLNLVQPVGSPSGHFSAGIGCERKPPGLGAAGIEVRMEPARLGLAAPGVPVERLRRGNFRQGAVPGAGIVVTDDLFYLAETALAQKAAGDVVLHETPLLGPNLADPLVLPCRLDHLAAFGDGEAHRFLAVNVLARLAGVDERQRMPMVRRGDDHRVDLFQVEHLAVVGEGVGNLQLRGTFFARSKYRSLVARISASFGTPKSCPPRRPTPIYPIPTLSFAPGEPSDAITWRGTKREPLRRPTPHF